MSTFDELFFLFILFYLILLLHFSQYFHTFPTDAHGEAIEMANVFHLPVGVFV